MHSPLLLQPATGCNQPPSPLARALGPDSPPFPPDPSPALGPGPDSPFPLPAPLRVQTAPQATGLTWVATTQLSESPPVSRAPSLRPPPPTPTPSARPAAVRSGATWGPAQGRWSHGTRPARARVARQARAGVEGGPRLARLCGGACARLCGGKPDPARRPGGRREGLREGDAIRLIPIREEQHREKPRSRTGRSRVASPLCSPYSTLP